ncbi:MAG TPA: condensation domain-containing protein, partial [Rhodothermales bacterium]
KQYLKERVPDYLVPAAVVVMQQLPRTPNGKLDARALPEPDVIEHGAFDSVAPRTEREALLAEIWESVLGMAPIGMHDNFFEIGGDSILSIQIVARMRQAGLRVSPAQFFEHQTIASLAAAVEHATPSIAARKERTGYFPLTPIQHWFFEQDLPQRDHWHHSLWLAVRDDVSPDRLRSALEAVVARHDALRTGFVRSDDGWRQRIVAPGSVGVTVEEFDESALERGTNALDTSIRLPEPPLLRAGLFSMPDGTRRLRLSIHHLVVDPISWQTILDDLEAALGEKSLPEPRTSFADWSDAIAAHALDPAIPDEVAYWTGMIGPKAASLPVDFPGGRFVEGSAQRVVVKLDAGETRTLLQDAHSAYDTNVEDLLLAALARTVSEWTGEGDVLVGLERHGREELLPGLDLTRTVGWFTSFFPVRLEASSDARGAIRSVRDRLCGIPARGIHFGVLRYLHGDPDVRAAMTALPHHEIVFNYTGRADRPGDDRALLRPLGPIAASRGSANAREHLLEVNAFVTQGCLVLHWSYSADLYRPEAIERLAGRYVDVLRDLIAHCLAPDAGGISAADFPEAGLTDDELERLLKTLG